MQTEGPNIKTQKFRMSKLTRTRRIAATISTLLVGRGMSIEPMNCFKNEKQQLDHCYNHPFICANIYLLVIFYRVKSHIIISYFMINPKTI